MDNFKITLKAARANSGLSIREVAKLLDVSYNTIRNWEKSPENISGVKLSKLCEIYQVPVSRLIFLPEDLSLNQAKEDK